MSDSNRTIVLKGNAKGHHEEGVLSTVCTPGMHVTLQSNGQYAKSPETSAELVKKGVFIACEDQHQGKTIADAYAIGDIVFLYKPVSGDHVNLFIKSGQNIAVGDLIVAEGGGSGYFIEAAGTEAQYKAMAYESSGGALGADAHIGCEWQGS
jgi:hypothetical protein